MVYCSLLSGTTDGSIYIHDILTPVGVADYKCPLITSIRGRYNYKVNVIGYYLASISTRPSAHSHGISMVQWYPHDTGIFTSSSVDKTLRIWDTNEMCVGRWTYRFDNGWMGLIDGWMGLING